MGFLLSSLCFLTISTVNVQIYQIDTFKIQFISICSFQGTFLLVHRPQLVFIKLLSASGDGEIRTLDPLLARQVLSQLSYAPILMGLSGLEPPTSRLSGVRSNRLSYKPIEIWHPPALPYRLQHSTIGRSCLNRRVRDGNGCFP